ncbi:MAG: formate dehydrogenase accessory protein FdhE [Betaproteobacteria bacterium]|nr:formate dehydrogenase accessory protein FdhE [Betaproteobacteria bacterium]
MGVTATVRVMSPEEIAARSGGETPYLLWPERGTHFAEREMRLRQLAANHPMREFLLFAADLAGAQQAQLAAYPVVALPDHEALDRAASRLAPPLAAIDFPRDPAWRSELRALLARLPDSLPAAARDTIVRVARAEDSWLEAQADCLLAGVTRGLDLAAAPLVAAGLQVYFTHLLLSVQASAIGRGQPFGRIEDETVCPACASKPVASVTRNAGDLLGQRYLGCSICGLQWHMVRIKCAHCLSTQGITYQSLQRAADEPDTEAAASAVAQAEVCDSCGHYLKIFHTDRDPHVDAAADDLATVTLDLLVSESGARRHGVNLMLLFGEPDRQTDDSADDEAEGHPRTSTEISAAGRPPTPPDPGPL